MSKSSILSVTSARHPDDPQRYLLSRSRAPDCIENDDIMEFTLGGAAVDAQGCIAHELLWHQPGLGELVSARRPAVRA